MAESTEKLPISEFYKVIDYVTIFKSKKWWEAIVVFEKAGGRRAIGVYLWVNRNDTWKRKSKFSVRNLDEWNKVKNAVEQLAPKLASQ
ncbi:MAG TPA: hypothetical protein VI864_03990 [Candidatus Bathyarchaeia archaeon]|nr:hypothetical protein [Candidatus Bathyarchaeia archaeon]